MRVEPEARKRELGQVGLAERDHAGFGRVGDDGGIGFGGGAVAIDFGAAGGDGAGNVDQILPGDGHAVQGPARGSVAVTRGTFFCFGAGTIGAHRNINRPIGGGGNAIEVILGQRHRIGFARPQPPAELVHAEPGEFARAAHAAARAPSALKAESEPSMSSRERLRTMKTMRERRSRSGQRGR